MPPKCSLQNCQLQGQLEHGQYCLQRPHIGADTPHPWATATADFAARHHHCTCPIGAKLKQPCKLLPLLLHIRCILCLVCRCPLCQSSAIASVTALTNTATNKPFPAAVHTQTTISSPSHSQAASRHTRTGAPPSVTSTWVQTNNNFLAAAAEQHCSAIACT